MDFDALGRSVREQLDSKNAAREQGLRLCRQTVRLSANAIRAVHRSEAGLADELLSQALTCLNDAQAALKDHPDIRYAGFFHDAAKEYAEGMITKAVVFGEPIPTPEDISVDAAAYLNGMGEAAGEMRRHLLDLMRSSNIGRAEEVLGTMDEIYYLLTSIDFPEAMTGGLRRTTDAVRGILERTRGDLTTTIIQSRLKEALEAKGK